MYTYKVKHWPNTMNRLNFLLLRKSRLQFIMLEVDLYSIPFCLYYSKVRGQIFIADACVNKCYWLARYKLL